MIQITKAVVVLRRMGGGGWAAPGLKCKGMGLYDEILPGIEVTIYGYDNYYHWWNTRSPFYYYWWPALPIKTSAFKFRDLIATLILRLGVC
jgi:hypothetical protein